MMNRLYILEDATEYRLVDDSGNTLSTEPKLSIDPIGNIHKPSGSPDGGQFTKEGSQSAGDESKIKSKAARMRKKDRKGFKSLAQISKEGRPKLRARVQVEGHGFGTVTNRGNEFFCFVTLDKNNEEIKVKHNQVKPLEET